MEYYSAINKNKIVSFPGNWMEMQIIMLNKISQAQKLNIACSRSFVEPRSKIMMTIITMAHECERGTIWGDQWEEEGKKKGY
jgi:hypothetical protein